MSAQIVIDDGTNPPVTGSVDNDNTFLGATHTLSNFDDTGVLAHRWELKDKPLGSSAALTDTTTPTTQITPDVAGDYLIQLITYLDAGATSLDDSDVQSVRVRLPGPFDWAVPAAGETTQHDSARGWATAREEAIRDVHTFMNSGLPSLVGAIDRETLGSDGLVSLGGFVLEGGLFPDVSLKLRLLGVLSSSGDGELSLWDMGAIGDPPTAVRRATATILSADSGNLVVRDTTLTVVASPGVDIGEISSARRKYELRAEIVGGAGADTFKVHQGSVTLEG